MMSPMTGRLIDEFLKEKGLKHKDLAARTGFEINYVSNVVSKGEGSTKFLLAVEKEFGLEPGALAQWNLIRAVIKICRKEGISLDDGFSWFERAARTFRDVRSGNAISETAQEPHDSQGTTPDSQEQANGESKKVTDRDRNGESDTRSLMSTWGVAFPAPPAFLFVPCAVCI